MVFLTKMDDDYPKNKENVTNNNVTKMGVIIKRV